MIIQLKKFGTMLVSRQAGKEAFNAFKPSLPRENIEENIEIDFEGVITFAPSWGDEFLTPFLKIYGNKLWLKNVNNPSVKATLEILEEVNKLKFKVR